MMHKHHYIYRTTNKLTGEYYLGMHSTNDLDDGYMGSGMQLVKNVTQHGRKNFTKEILKFAKDRQELNHLEAFYITDQMLNDPQCLNRKPGGQGGNIYMVRNNNQTIKATLHEAAQTTTAKQNRIDAFERINHQKGTSNSQHGTCWVFNANLKMNQKINKKEVEAYLEQGWLKGRRMHY